MSGVPADPFVGDLVRLRGRRAEDRDDHLRLVAEADLLRTGRMDAAAPWSDRRLGAWLEETDTKPGKQYAFVIEAREDGHFVGQTGLVDVDPVSRHAMFGISVVREEWSRGYATDATRVVLRFAFDDLDLHKVKLGVIAGHDAAIAVYTRCGFRVDARLRQHRFRDGTAHDELLMSVLSDEWRTS